MEQLGDNFGTTLGDVLETTLALLKKYLWTNGESTPSTTWETLDFLGSILGIFGDFLWAT